MGTDRNSTHTVVVKTENRGIRVVVGALVLYMWLRWWWTGSLFASVASAMPADVQDGQFGSVTGTLLPIAVDLLGFVGSLVISVLSLGWRAVWDVFSGVLETFGLWRKQDAATHAAVDAATQSATNSAAKNAGAVIWPGEKAASNYVAKRRVDLDKVAAAIQSQDTELDDLDKLVSDLQERLAKFESTVPAVGLLAVVDRLAALEKACPAEGGYRDVVARLTAIEEWAKKLHSAQDAINEATNDRLGRLEICVANIEPVKKPAKRRVTRQRSPKAKA